MLQAAGATAAYRLHPVRHAWLPLLLVLFATPLHAVESARDWLDRMSDAMQALDYDGTFVYQHGNNLDVMRIVHRVDEGGRRERLVSLTGSEREVLRDDRSVTCIMPDNKSVMVGQTPPPRPFPVVPEDLNVLKRSYLLEDMGEQRLLGYQARVIGVSARDELRYSYRFWIENDSHMLLKTDLTDTEGNPIEQLVFTNLAIGNSVSNDDLKPSLTGEGYSWQRQVAMRTGGGQAVSSSDWVVRKLPPGFVLTDVQHRRMREQGGKTEHHVYSDGMATVSVYFEQVAGDHARLDGLSTMGAMNAFSAEFGGHQVTVVGEVPVETVMMIASSVGKQN